MQNSKKRTVNLDGHITSVFLEKEFWEEIVFLSANTWDVSGGGNYGYNSVWINRNKSYFDNLDYHPKNEVGNLTQLLDIV